MSQPSYPQSVVRHDEQEPEGCKSKCYWAGLVQGLIAILITCFCLVFLSSLGIITSSATRCTELLDESADCETRQDIKALMSFLFGALVITLHIGSQEAASLVILGSSESGFRWDLQGALTLIESCAGLI
eukprot:TRINITY_DN3801_c0_g1_i2.p1 TRINITY_DN3801_c0_g1~~TRINITY_DN3801_c0_g1_i2.p1  ORF type:complete len:130 (+),score=19.56 TRINITY_DN3801_c0_g1_i2:112-501(+)